MATQLKNYPTNPVGARVRLERTHRHAGRYGVVVHVYDSKHRMGPAVDILAAGGAIVVYAVSGDYFFTDDKGYRI